MAPVVWVLVGCLQAGINPLFYTLLATRTPDAHRSTVLAFSYVPAPNVAYDTLQFITHDAVLGSVVRGIHAFGSSAMVVLVALGGGMMKLFDVVERRLVPWRGKT